VANPIARRAALPAQVGRVATDLADAIAECSAIGIEPPEDAWCALIELERWAEQLQTGRVRPLLRVADGDLDEWVRELRGRLAVEELPPPSRCPPRSNPSGTGLPHSSASPDGGALTSGGWSER